MSDSPEKRRREAQKRRNREMKAERKRLRKEGLLGYDNSGLFPPGVQPRESVDMRPPAVAPSEEKPPASEPKSDGRA